MERDREREKNKFPGSSECWFKVLVKHWPVSHRHEGEERKPLHKESCCSRRTLRIAILWQ